MGNIDGFYFVRKNLLLKIMSNYIVLQDIKQWNQISQNNMYKKILIMGTAHFCNPCKLIKPRIQGLSKEFNDVLFLIVDVEKFSQIAEYFSINSMPTFIILSNNQVVKTIVGGDLVSIRHALTNI